MTEVTRAEFGMLREMVNDNARRLDEIDRSGTRGVGALSVQVAEVIKDVADVRRDLSAFRHEHAEQHQAEQSARTVTRRWLIGTLIAAFVAIEGPLTYLIAHLR